MAADASASLQVIIERHQAVLNSHNAFLSSLQSEIQAGTGIDELLRECVSQTDVMSQSFKSTKHVLLSTSNPVSSDEYGFTNTRPKRPLPTGPRREPNDSTKAKPTPAEGLLGRPLFSAVIRTKRKAPDSDEGLRFPAQSPNEIFEQTCKKLRTEEGPAPTQNGGEDKPTVEEYDLPQEPFEISPAGDSFIQQVEERLRKKELKRQKKQERKRKRESATSDISMTGVQQEVQDIATSVEKPQRKKPRPLGSFATPSTLSTSETTSQSGQSTPPAKRAENKRASPAREYLESVMRIGPRTRSRQY